MSYYLVLAVVSWAAGLALGRVLHRRTRRYLLAGGVLAALAGAALIWATSHELLRGALDTDLLAAGLWGVAAMSMGFAVGASLTGP